MIRIKAVALPVFALLVAGVSLGADDLVGQRKAVMNDNVKQQTAASNQMLGKFNADKAAAAMQKIEDNVRLFLTLFPGDAPDGDKAVLAAVWSDRAGFEAAAQTLVDKAEAARLAAPQGVKPFAIAWGEVSSACDGCHAKYAAPD